MGDKGGKKDKEKGKQQQLKKQKQRNNGSRIRTAQGLRSRKLAPPPSGARSQR